MDDNNSDNQNTQSDVNTNDLDKIKERALKELAPILKNVTTLDPEQKFDMCMSAIRFTDDKDIAQIALDAALAIEDAGPKAEALVTLVNEINYLQQA